MDQGRRRRHRQEGRRRPGDPRGRDRRAARPGGRHDRRLLRRQIQFAAAGFERDAGTDRLDAIIPLITWNDLAYSLAPENSALPAGTAESGSVSSGETGVFKYQWAALFTTVGVANGAEDLPPAERRRPPGRRSCSRAAPTRPAGLHGAGSRSRGLPSQATSTSCAPTPWPPTWRHPVPTLIGQGQADTLFNLQESVATYTALQGQGTPVSLVWQSWGRSDSTPWEGSWTCGTRPSPTRDGRPWPGSSTTCAGGAGARAELRLLPRLGVRRDGRRRAGVHVRAAYPAGTRADLLLSGEAARSRRIPGADPAAVATGHEQPTPAPRRSDPTTGRPPRSTRSSR